MATYLRPPAILPLFKADGHAFQDDDLYATRPRHTGHHRKRRVWTDGPRTVDVSWILEQDQMAALDSWAMDSLQNYSKRFIATVKTEEGIRYWEAAWVEPFVSDPMPTPRGVMWAVEGSIVTFGSPTVEPPETGELAAENVLALEGEAVIFGPAALAAENTLALEAAQTLRAENTLALESFLPFFLLTDAESYLLIDGAGNRLRI